MLRAVVCEPLEVLRSIGIERAAPAHLRRCEQGPKTQEVLVLRPGGKRIVEHTSSLRNALSTSEQKLDLNAHTPARVGPRFGADRVVEDLALKIDAPPA